MSGGYAWDVIRRNASVREAVNRWLSDHSRLKTPYELRIRRFIAPEEERNAAQVALKRIAARLIEGDATPEQIVEALRRINDQVLAVGLEYTFDDRELSDQFLSYLLTEELVSQLNEPVLWDIQKETIVSHRDVGIGVSQVLPVLVGSYGSQNQLIAIEQPEIHLHHALQAELADVFIESALGERRNTFILETHSEHMILRLLRRIREGRLQPDDICVLYVEPLPGRGSRVIELRVDEDGDFVDSWPGGFFEESYRERFAGR